MNQPARDLAADYSVRDESVPEAAAHYPLKRMFDFALATAALLGHHPAEPLVQSLRRLVGHLGLELEIQGSHFSSERRRPL